MDSGYYSDFNFEQLKMDKKLKPIGLNILIKPVIEEETKTIILLDTDKKKASTGIIIEISEQLEGEEFKKGDKVIFKQYATEDIKIDGEDYLIVEEDAILGILE